MELPVDPNQVGPVCLVTGGNGYVGKHLVRRLLELGCEVRAFDLAPFQGDARVQSIVGDIRRMRDLGPACDGVDTVFHTAAIINTLTLARASVRRLVYGVNVLGTECVIRACQAAGVKKLIFTSSITVSVDGPIREGDETAPYVGTDGLPDLYSQTKSRAEKMVLEADDSEGLRTAAVRPGGVWGPGEGAMMVQDFLEHLAAGQFKLKIGDGKSVTDNVHVDSVVDVHFLVAKKLSEDPELVGGQAYFVSDDEPTNPVGWYRPDRRRSRDTPGRSFSYPARWPTASRISGKSPTTSAARFQCSPGVRCCRSAKTLRSASTRRAPTSATSPEPARRRAFPG